MLIDKICGAHLMSFNIVVLKRTDDVHVAQRCTLMYINGLGFCTNYVARIKIYKTNTISLDKTVLNTLTLDHPLNEEAFSS